LALSPLILRLCERLRFSAGPLRLKTAQEAQRDVGAYIPAHTTTSTAGAAAVTVLGVTEPLTEKLGYLLRLRYRAPVEKTAENACVRGEELLLRDLDLDLCALPVSPPTLLPPPFLFLLALVLEQVLHDLKHAKRDSRLAVSRLQRSSGAEDLRARRDAAVLHVVEDAEAVWGAAEVAECDEEGEEVRGVVLVVWRCDGRGVVAFGVAATAAGMALMGVVELRAALEEQVVEGEKVLLRLAEVGEG